MATKECPTCKGSTCCPVCKGAGKRYFSGEKCPKCQGTGSCTRCRGNGVVPKN